MKTIILAPHSDDELLNCYSILQEGNVSRVYYHKVDSMPGAYECAKHFKFEPIFHLPEQKDLVDCMVYIPHKDDLHPDHKFVNQYAKRAFTKGKLMFYTTDRNVSFKLLPKEWVEEKRRLLNQFYPSKRLLWDNDEKYLLFEGFTDREYKYYGFVTLIREGYHKYPNAPEEVSFLRNLHRHLFHIRIQFEQTHSDRDIEYFIFKRWLLEQLHVGNVSNKSCEMLAEEIREMVLKKIGYDRDVIVEVNEDGENGAIVR